MLKFLIIGAEGFVGRNLVDGLSEKFQILTSDITRKNGQDNYSQCDITNYNEVINTVKDVDVVINLATHSLVSSLGQETKNAQVNIIGLLNILCACRENNIKKIIFTSASSLIGEPGSLEVSENHPTTPKTAYGITKLASEHYLRLFQELYEINFVVFRFFNIYGPYQKNGLIPNLFSRMKSTQPVTVFGEGDQIRDYVYINDILDFFKTSISSNKADNHIINMGTGVGHSIMEVINIMSEKLNVKPKIDFKPKRVGEIDNFVADTSLIKDLFGKSPSTNLEIGLAKTIDWLNSNNF